MDDHIPHVSSDSLSGSGESDIDSESSDSEPTDSTSHIHSKGDFFGCYLLISKNPKFKGRTYIGFTVDPNRRIKQHNGGHQMGGARRTSGRGPWDMILIIHGFPSEISALRFEWAWQNPAKSRRLSKGVARKKTKETAIQFRFRVVTEMLSVGPWNRLPLTIRWLKQEYEMPFPLNRQPPIHMPIAYGLVGIAKAGTRLQLEPTPSQTDQDSDSFPIQSDTMEDRGKINIESGKCLVCSKHFNQDESVHCYKDRCSMSAHITCLAMKFCTGEDEGSGTDEDRCHLIPVTGQCPMCKHNLMWGELIKAYRMRNFEQVKQVGPPFKKCKTNTSAAASVINTEQNHWTQSLHL